jgi:hypothetical protein
LNSRAPIADTPDSTSELTSGIGTNREAGRVLNVWTAPLLPGCNWRRAHQFNHYAPLIFVSKSVRVRGLFCPVFFPTFGQRGESSRRSAMRQLVEFLRSCSRSIPTCLEVLFTVAHAVPCEWHGAIAPVAFLNPRSNRRCGVECKVCMRGLFYLNLNVWDCSGFPPANRIF